MSTSAIHRPHPRRQRYTRAAVRDALEVVRTLLLGVFLPFEVYAVLGKAGLDITAATYGAVVVILAATFCLIVIQGVTAAARTGLGTCDSAPFLFDRRIAPPHSNHLPLGEHFSHHIAAETTLLTGYRSDAAGERDLSGIDRFVWVVWRPAYVWLVLQAIPLAIYWIWHRGTRSHWEWALPLLALGAVYILHSAPAQTVFAYVLASPAVRRQRRWFVADLALAMMVGEGIRNTIARVAQLRIIFIEGPDSAAPAARNQAMTAPSSASDVAIADRPATATAETPPSLALLVERRPRPAEEVAAPPAAEAAAEEDNPRLRGAMLTLHELEGLALRLSEQVDAWHGERDQLSARIAELRRAVGPNETTIERIATQETPAIGTLEAALDALAADRSDLRALATVSRSAGTLAEVVHRYAAVQEAIETIDS